MRQFGIHQWSQRINAVSCGAERGQLPQFFHAAVKAVAHRQIRFQKSLVPGQQLTAHGGLRIYQGIEQIVCFFISPEVCVRFWAETSIWLKVQNEAATPSATSKVAPTSRAIILRLVFMVNVPSLGYLEPILLAACAPEGASSTATAYSEIAPKIIF